MGTWSVTNSGLYTLTGSGRTAFISDATLPANSEFRLQLRAPADGDGVFVLMPSSKDGRTAYEIGLSGANLVIRSILFAEPASVVIQATVAHGLASGSPFTLGVRLVNGVLEARLNNAAAATLSHTPTMLSGYKHFGFVSNVDGAKVILAEVCTLIPRTNPRDDVLCAACVGDGSRAWIIDPRALTAEPYIPTDGTLPSQGADGTTAATMIALHRGRLWFAGMPDDPQNLFACAVNNPLDMNSFSGTLGKAFGLTAANIGVIGEPITCIIASTRNTLIIGCVGSVWELIGDPATNNVELTKILSDCGISGKDAVATTTDGRMIFHTPEGAYLLPPVGGPVKLSQQVLTEQINVPRDTIDQYAMQVRRDPATNIVHFFRTKRGTTQAALHFAYDERIGQFNAALGGWLPDTFAARFGPTASTPEPFKGRVILGTRQGLLGYLDEATNTDDGDTIIPRIPLSLFIAALINRETILHSYNVQPKNGATVKYRLWGARTAAQVYNIEPGRKLLQSGEFGDHMQRVTRKSRAPALMLELYNDDGTEFGIEDADANTSIGRLMSRHDITAAAAPESPCSAPFMPRTSSESSSSLSHTGIPESSSGASGDTVGSTASVSSTTPASSSNTPPASSSISSGPGFSSLTATGATLTTGGSGTGSSGPTNDSVSSLPTGLSSIPVTSGTVASGDTVGGTPSVSGTILTQPGGTGDTVPSGGTNTAIGTNVNQDNP